MSYILHKINKIKKKKKKSRGHYLSFIDKLIYFIKKYKRVEKL